MRSTRHRSSWTSYLENEADLQGEVQFETPEDLARAFIRERLEKTDVMNRLGEIKPELTVKEANIQALEDELSFVWDNARSYNEDGSEIFEAANELEVRFYST